ncbi:hypothetical protein AKJ16_DCAP19781 [Drosera capensis]
MRTTTEQKHPRNKKKHHFINGRCTKPRPPLTSSFRPPPLPSSHPFSPPLSSSSSTLTSPLLLIRGTRIRIVVGDSDSDSCSDWIQLESFFGDLTTVFERVRKRI